MTWPMRLAFGAVLMFLVTMPWLLVPLTVVNGHDAARMVQLVLMTWCAGMLVLDKGMAFQQLIPKHRVLQVGGLLLVGLAVLSVLHAERPLWAFVEFTAVLGLLGVAAVVAAASDRAVTCLLYAVLVAVGMSAAIEITVAVSVLFAGLELNVWFFGTGYVNHRFMNHTQTVALPLATMALFCASIRPRWLRYAAWFGVAMGYAVLFFLGGRGTWLGLGGGLLCAVGLLGKRAWPLLYHTGLCVLMGLLLYALIFQLLPWWLGSSMKVPMNDRIADIDSFHLRLQLWKWAWDSFKAQPWLGIGPMQLAHHVNKVGAHPHNFYLQLLAEWGGLVALLCSLGLVRVVMCLKASTNQVSQMVPRYLLLWPVLAVLIDSGFSGVLVMPVSQVWCGVLGGMLLCKIPVAKYVNRETGRIFIRTTAAVTLLTALILVWYLLLDQWLYLSSLIDSLQQQFPAVRLRPRWWVHGWIK